MMKLVVVAASLLVSGCGKKKDNGTAGSAAGSAAAQPTATASAGAAPAEQLAIAGDIYFKAADGTVKVWGTSPAVLGENPNDEDRSKPTVVADLAKTKRLAAGGGQTMCAAMLDGSLKCWGNGASGELGDIKLAKSDKAVVVSGVTNVADVGIGSYFVCALIGDGTVKCWGTNNFNQASVEKLDKAPPTAMPGVTGAKQIAVGDDFACALGGDGSVKCWGLRCGAEGPNLCVKPFTVEKLAGATSIAAGGDAMCAIMKDATVQCFGENEYGQLGNGTKDEPPAGQLVTVKGLAGAKQLAAGSGHWCALMNDGTAQCWGSNEYGQLGDGKAPDAEADRGTPAPVVGVSDAVAVACGSGTCCAQLKDKSLKCWGENLSGSLFGEANKDSEKVSTAVAVAAP